MSIFALNIATLLGFGLGVDYALLLASRFREELAARGGGRMSDGTLDRRSRSRRRSRPRSLPLVAPCSSAASPCCSGCQGCSSSTSWCCARSGIAGAIVVGLAVAARAHAAARRSSRSSARASTRLPVRRRSAGGSGVSRHRTVGSARSRGLLVAPGQWVMDRPVAGVRPDAARPGRARPAVPARPLQRPRREHPAARTSRRGSPTTRSSRSSARATSGRCSSPSGRTARSPTRRTSGGCTTTRGSSPLTRG